MKSINVNCTTRIVLKVFPTRLYSINQEGILIKSNKSKWFEILIRISGYGLKKPLYTSFNRYLYWYTKG